VRKSGRSLLSRVALLAYLVTSLYFIHNNIIFTIKQEYSIFMFLFNIEND